MVKKWITKKNNRTKLMHWTLYIVVKWQVSIECCYRYFINTLTTYFVFKIFYFFIVLGTKPYYQFEIPVKSDEFDSDQHDIGLSCCLKFEYVEKYPDDVPIVEIEDVIGFEDQESVLKEYLIEQV